MPKTPINTLKSWFRRGLKPLENQFHSWMDSFWHKDELIPIASVNGLQDALNSSGGSGGGSGSVVVNPSVTITGTATYNVLAQALLNDVVIIGSVSQNVKIGTSPGQGDVMDENIAANTAFVLTLKYFASVGQTLYFTASDCVATLYFAENIPESENATLPIIGSQTFDMDADKLLSDAVFTASTDQAIKIGTLAGQGDILDDNVIANTPYVITLKYYSQASQTLHLTAANCSAKLYVQ